MSNRVVIIMGSKADLEHAEQIEETLHLFGVESTKHIASAHKTPAYLLELLQAFEEEGKVRVYITIAGRSNALSGFVDAQVSLPVIACPPYSHKFAGGDIYSSMRMPSGVAPLLVLEPRAAALAAAKILSLKDGKISQAVRAYQQSHRDRVIGDDQTLNEEVGE